MPSTLSFFRYSALSIALAVTLFLAGSHTPTALEQVLSSGELHIISRNGPTTYYEGPQGLEGYEYLLAKGFADELGVELVIREQEDLGNMFNRVANNPLRLAAAGLTITPERQKQVRFTRPYLEVQQVVIYRAGEARPKAIEDLYNKSILTIAHSSHAETLKKLSQQHPSLAWKEQSDLEMSDIIEMVHKGEVDIAVVDSNALDLNRNLYPRARKAFFLNETPDRLAWAFQKSSDDSLFARADAYLTKAQDSGFLAQLNESIYGQIPDLDRGSALTFAHRLETRLPRWQEDLANAGDSYDLDWMLLAAMSYQESHWNSRARSYTGVRGLMMLTLTTAKEMGVDNRLDPIQSIHGGAKYFRKIYDRIPSDIENNDRTWMALAAYNVGYGHLEDARVLTERMGYNPHKWEDVRKHLPLLAKRSYYRTVKHGYARGWEPVKYVDNIRSFYTTIALHQQIQNRRLAYAARNSIVPVDFHDDSTGDDLSML